MEKLVDLTKNLFLDAFASIRGFLYGFLVISLAIGIIGVVFYVVAFIYNKF